MRPPSVPHRPLHRTEDHAHPRRRRLLVGLLFAPLLTGCFASSGSDDGDSSSDAGSGSRLKVALAFPPAENLSPYGADAALLSRLGVTEG